MTDAPATRRRRFRFSLRTYFITFTVFAVWFGWNMHLVRKRKEFLAALPPPHYVREYPPSHVGGPPRASEAKGLTLVSYRMAEPTETGISWTRRLLGDKPIWFIAYYPGPTLQRAAELFPEAVVVRANDSWPWPDMWSSIDNEK